MAASDPITAALNIGTSVIERLFPDPKQQSDAKLQLLSLAQSGDLQLVTAQAGIITAEANSESWITRSWRPILMLTFGALIVARWFGFTAQNISEAEYLELWAIVKLGLGGYVIGRSAEKIAPGIIEALSSKK